MKPTLLKVLKKGAPVFIFALFMLISGVLIIEYTASFFFVILLWILIPVIIAKQISKGD